MQPWFTRKKRRDFHRDFRYERIVSERLDKQTTNYYSTVFGSKVFDLSDIEQLTQNQEVRINAVFSSVIVRLNPRVPAKIELSTTFGTVDLPNGKTYSFGTAHYETPSFNTGVPHLHVYINVVFGSVEVELVESPQKV